MYLETLMLRFIATISCTFFLLANSTFAQTAKINKAEVDADAMAWQDAFNAHDAKVLSMQFAKDADVHYYPDPPLKGRAEIVKWYTEFFAKNPKAKTKITPVSRRMLTPTLIVEDGMYQDSGLSGEAKSVKGYYTTILRKTDSGWTNVHDRSWPAKDAKASKK